MSSITLSDLVNTTTFVIGLINDCRSAARDQQDLVQQLDNLIALIRLSETTMERYILDQDQLNAWHSSLENFKTSITHLHKRLAPRNYKLSLWYRIRFAMWTKKRAEKELKVLRAKALDIHHLDETIQTDVADRRLLENLKETTQSRA